MRVTHWPSRRRGATPPGARTLIVGAGDAGRTLAHDLQQTPSCGLAPIGFLDDDLRKRHAVHLPVLGRLADLPRLARAEGAEVVIVAIPSLPPVQLATLLHQATRTGARVRYLPSFHAAVQRGSRAGDLYEVSPAALLGREEINVIRPATPALIRGRRVLVTGAGGSIGSELCRQIRAYGPEALYMLDHDESNLHRLQLEITGEALLEADELIVADIRDVARVNQLFATLHPELVFHAAAHKHLPLLERHPCEGVKSNVEGTKNLIDAAVAHGAHRFVLISTDKAAAPTSVLGATKRLAELIVRAHTGNRIVTGSVRFGNVLGSRGSFLDVLAHQIAAHEPVTITDPAVDRFFMTVEEAVGLVLEAAAMAESGETFVLDMGAPVQLVSLVEAYAALAGVPDVTIKFTGLRPGEKLSETLLGETEERIPTGHPRIFATRGLPVPSDLDAGLAELSDAAERNDSEAAGRWLAKLIPGYRPAGPHVPTARELFDAFYPDDF